MQCGCILCQRALYTLRKCKATQARTISKDSKLWWPSSTSPRHTNSCYFRGAQLLIQRLRWEIDFRQFVFPSFNTYENHGDSWRSWTPQHWVLHKQTAAPALKRLLPGKEQYLDIALVTQRHLNPHSGYFTQQVNSCVTGTVTKIYASHCNNPDTEFPPLDH